MRILFACGGTAGHINPALSIAAEIRARAPGAVIRFAGNPGGMEARLVRDAGFDFVPFRAMGIQRRLTPGNIVRNVKSAGLLLTSEARAGRVIREFAPDLVVGTGGYVSGPVLMTACKLGIPTATHEQNAFPGVTTKMLARRVDKVLLAVEKARDYLPRGVPYVVTGNPVRPQVLTCPAPTRQALRAAPRSWVSTWGRTGLPVAWGPSGSRRPLPTLWPGTRGRAKSTTSTPPASTG